MNSKICNKFKQSLCYISTGWWNPFIIGQVILLLLAIDRQIPNNDENSKLLMENCHFNNYHIELIKKLIEYAAKWLLRILPIVCGWKLVSSKSCIITPYVSFVYL